MIELPERAAANDAAEKYRQATTTRAELAKSEIALRDTLAERRAEFARITEGAAVALSEGKGAPAIAPLDLRQAETDHAILNRALEIAEARTAELRSQSEFLESIAANAEDEAARKSAVDALAARGLRIDIHNHRSETARLIVIGNFACTELDDAAHLAALVKATGSWPHGKAKALAAVQKLAANQTKRQANAAN